MNAALAFCALAFQGQPATLPHTDFSKDEGGWTSISPTGKTSISREVLRGKATGTLKFDYSIAQGQMDAIILSTGQMPLGKMRSLRFWVRPDHDTTFGVFLQESEGGRYVALASARKDGWQLVELSPSDFVLSVGPDDPIDPNGKLDLSFVEAIGVADFKQMIAQAGEELVTLFGVKTGPHAFYLSDFMAAANPLPDVSGRIGSEARIDTFERPQPGWVGAGQTSLSVDREGPIIGAALKADYSVSPKSLSAMFRSLMPGSLAGTGQLEFSIASAQPCTLVVQLEEKSGGKYNYTLEMKGSPKAEEIVLPFSEFGAADDSRDVNGKLDPDDVKQLLFLDVTGLLGGVEKSNTLWIGSVIAKPAP